MPIVDTVVLFSAADSEDPHHAGAVKCLRNLGREGLLLGEAALVEFDLVLKSRGFAPAVRREEMILLMHDFPATLSSRH